jgi:predicted dehydrogenase
MMAVSEGRVDMGKRVNIGIIGGGWIAEHAHIPILMQKENVNVAAVFDENTERLHKLCDKFSIPGACHTINDFLRCGLDGAIISTPNYTHYTYTMKMLDEGIGVLCEKPVALNTAEVQDIIQKAGRSGVVYIPGFVNRWRQEMQMAYREVERGTIGNVEKIEAGWLRKSGVPRPGTWFTLKKYAGGGVLVDLGSHVLDLCLMFLGNSKPVKYQLTTSPCRKEELNQTGGASWFARKESAGLDIDVEKSAIIDVVCENEIQIKANLSWKAPVEADCTYFKMCGSRGKLDIRTLFGFSQERLWQEDSLIIESSGEKKILHLDPENSTWKAFDEMLSHFADALAGRETDIVTPKDALKVVSLTECLYAHESVNPDEVYTKLREDI